MTRQTKRTGFTIVELLVVIVVIGILAAVTTLTYVNVQQKSRDAVRQSDISNVKEALELYYNDHGYYPSVGNDDWGYDMSLLATPLSGYLSKIPTDPKSGVIYSYVRGPASNNSYGILIYYEAKAVCKDGVNINSGWWGTSVPNC